MNRLHITITAALFALALPLTAAAQHHHGMHHHKQQNASADPIFVAYETARQALIKGSVSGVQNAAKALDGAARDARQKKLADLAAALETASDLDAARDAFAAVSDEAIRYRKDAEGPRPAVVYCPMEKKSWLQPVGKVGNPYVDSSMRTCGEFVPDESDAQEGGAHRHSADGTTTPMSPMLPALHGLHGAGDHAWFWIGVVMVILMPLMML